MLPIFVVYKIHGNYGIVIKDLIILSHNYEIAKSIMRLKVIIMTLSQL